MRGLGLLSLEESDPHVATGTSADASPGFTRDRTAFWGIGDVKKKVSPGQFFTSEM